MISDRARETFLVRNGPTGPGRPSSPRRPALALVLGALLIAGAAYGLGRMEGGGMTGRWISDTDERVAAWFHMHQAPGLAAAMNLATALGSAAWVTAVTSIAALGLAFRRRWRGLLALGLAVPGGMAANVWLKASFHRPRPGAEAWTAVFSGYGFPSGHTMAATLLYGALAFLALSVLDNRRARLGVVLGAGALVGLVAWSRLQLGAHFLSDVVGAVAAGLAWLGLCLAALPLARLRA